MIDKKNKISKYVQEVEELLPKIIKKKLLFVEKGAQLKELDITFSQVNILSLLINKNCTMSEISEETSLALNTITGNVDRLVRDKLVVRIPDKTDRRIVRIKLSNKGKQKIEKYIKFRQQHLTKVFSSITEKDRKKLVIHLKDIYQILEKAKIN